MTDALSPFSASGQIIANGIFAARIFIVRWCSAGRFARKESVHRGDFQLQFAQDLLKSPRSEFAAVLTPM
jgi:hypothetical protein